MKQGTVLVIAAMIALSFVLGLPAQQNQNNFGSGVTVSGAVTAGHIATFASSSAIQDGGAASAGTVTHSAGNLTLNCVVVGNASADLKCSANTTDDGTTFSTSNASGITAAGGPITAGATGVGGTVTIFGTASGSNTLTAPGNGTQLSLSAATLNMPSLGAVGSTTGQFTVQSGGGSNLVLSASGNLNLSPASGKAVVTSTNCAGVGTAANPSVASCTAALAGSFSCATNASTGTCVVNTTAVTANSQVLITQRTDTATGTRLGVTCNTTIDTVQRAVTAVTAATSFTINLGTITTNPECFSYLLIN